MRRHYSPDSGNPLDPLTWQALRLRRILNRRAFVLGADRARMIGQTLADRGVTLATRCIRAARMLRAWSSGRFVRDRRKGR